MPPQTQTNKEHDTLARAERLQSAITLLEARKSQLESEGEVAPSGCYVARYQARGQRQTYWYYKLQAKTPIFPKASDRRACSRYKHLGPAGSAAHVDGVVQVVRRVQIDELTKAIDFLKQSWSDLYPETKNNKNQHKSKNQG
jgi:hypothetical protein